MWIKSLYTIYIYIVVTSNEPSDLKHTNIIIIQRVCFGDRREQVEAMREIWLERAMLWLWLWLPKHAACQDTSCASIFLPFTRQLNLHCGDKLFAHLLFPIGYVS